MNVINRTKEFDKWLDKLQDEKAQIAIFRRILRAKQGNFGDYKSVGQNLYEMRISVGQGYRVYYTKTGQTIYLLVLGGNKSTQEKDIAKAKNLLKNIHSREVI